MDVLLWIAAGVLVLIGIAGAVLPSVPGPILVFGGLLLGAWVDGFTRIGGTTIGVMALLTILAYAADFAASALGAKSAGATRRGVVGAAVGTVIGLFMGLAGLLVGPFIGAAVGEFTARRDVLRAGKVGIATWLGIMMGAAIELALIFLMIGLFLLALLF